MVFAPLCPTHDWFGALIRNWEQKVRELFFRQNLRDSGGSDMGREASLMPHYRGDIQHPQAQAHGGPQQW